MISSHGAFPMLKTNLGAAIQLVCLPTEQSCHPFSPRGSSWGKKTRQMAKQQRSWEFFLPSCVKACLSNLGSSSTYYSPYLVSHIQLSFGVSLTAEKKDVTTYKISALLCKEWWMWASSSVISGSSHHYLYSSIKNPRVTGILWKLFYISKAETRWCVCFAESRNCRWLRLSLPLDVRASKPDCPDHFSRGRAGKDLFVQFDAQKSWSFCSREKRIN